MPPIVWIALSAIGGALLGVIANWLSAASMTAKQFGLAVIMAIIAALVFAGAYQISQGGINFYDVFSAIVGGFAAVMGQVTVAHQLGLRKPKTPKS